MNKKINYMLSIIIIVIFMAICIEMVCEFTNMNNSKNVNAKLANNEIIELRISKIDESNEELYIDFNNISIASMTLEIFFDTESLEYENNMENSNYSNGRLLYTWVSETGRNEQISKIGPFKFKKLSDANSKIVVTGEFYNEKGERINIDSQSTNIVSTTQNINTNNEENIENENGNSNSDNNTNISKDNTNLAVLRLNHEGISPNFSKEIKEYYIVVDESINKFNITAIAENPNSKVSITGNEKLKTGLNTININVKSEDKTKETNYKIYVTKTSDMEKANANLENLAVEDGALNPEFNANITNYKVEVSNSIDAVNVFAVPERINAKVNINKNNKLEVGDNTIEITVNAEDNITKKKYIVVVHRRTNDEETQAEEIKAQAERLSAILQENDNINNNMEKEVVGETNNEVTSTREEASNKTYDDIYVYSAVGIVLILIIICVIYNKRKKSKTT